MGTPRPNDSGRVDKLDRPIKLADRTPDHQAAANDLDAAVAADTAPPAQPGLRRDPFAGWAHRPPENETILAALEQVGWICEWSKLCGEPEAVDHGISVFGDDKNRMVAAIVDVADLRPEWVSVAERYGLIETYEVVGDADGIEVLDDRADDHVDPYEMRADALKNDGVHLEIAQLDVLAADGEGRWQLAAFTMGDTARARFHDRFGTRDRDLEAAVKDSWPDDWERVTGQKVQLEESSVLRRRKFYADHANDPVGTQIQHHGAPAGKVIVFTSIGGDPKGRPEQWLVDEARYMASVRSGQPGYVVDPEHDTPWENPSS